MVVLGVWVLAAVVARADDVPPRQSPDGKPHAFKLKSEGQTALPPWSGKWEQVEKDRQIIWRPAGEGRALPRQEPEPIRPHEFPGGRARAIKQLMEGDPFAWSIVGGMGGALLLALVVAAFLRGRRGAADAAATPDPARIIEAWQKQRVVCLASAWTLLPLGFALWVVVGVTWDEILAPLITLLPAFFLVFVICFTDWRCPACGGWMGRNTNPTFCPKCGVQLRED
jgi:hypothetical protein